MIQPLLGHGCSQVGHYSTQITKRTLTDCIRSRHIKEAKTHTSRSNFSFCVWDDKASAILGAEDGNASIFNIDSVWHLLDSCCANFLVVSFQFQLRETLNPY